MTDRAALTGILFVLQSGLAYEIPPLKMCCGSGMTRWRRLRDWQQEGVWDQLQRRSLDHLGQRNAIDFRHVPLESANLPLNAWPALSARGPESVGLSSPCNRIRPPGTTAEQGDPRVLVLLALSEPWPNSANSGGRRHATSGGPSFISPSPLSPAP